MRDDYSSPDVNPDGSLADTTTTERDDTRSWRTRLHRAGWTVGIWQRRLTGWTRTLARAVGLAVAVIGAANLLATAATIGAPLPYYRAWFPLLATTRQGVYYVADVLAIAVGAAAAWLV